MANKIRQYRFDRANSSKNYNISNPQDLVTGDFTSGYTPIIQLGIQALPGTHFYLNESHEPITIGESGIFELELKGVTEISKIQSKREDLVLIIDTIYISNEEGGV